MMSRQADRLHSVSELLVDFELPASFAESYYRWHEWKPPNLQRDFGILRSLVGN